MGGKTGGKSVGLYGASLRIGTEGLELGWLGGRLLLWLLVMLLLLLFLSDGWGRRAARGTGGAEGGSADGWCML